MRRTAGAFLAGAIVALAAVLAAQRLRPSQLWLLVMFGAGAVLGMAAAAICAGGPSSGAAAPPSPQGEGKGKGDGIEQ